MPLPKYQATGTLQANTIAVTPTWPTHLTNDIGLLMVEAAGGETISLSTAAGFVEVTNSPQTTGTSPAGTKIAVFWCRATSNAMSAPTVADPGDHCNAIIVTFRGCVTSGNPWDVTAGGVKASASTTGSATGVTTTVHDTLVVNCIARDNDLAAAAFSGQTNADLSQLTELTGTDTGTALGGGGGFVMFAGNKANAGAVTTTGFTVTSSINAYLTIALKGDLTAPTAGDPNKPPGRCLYRQRFESADNLVGPQPVGWATADNDGISCLISNGLRQGLDGITGGYFESCTAFPSSAAIAGSDDDPNKFPLASDWDILVDFSTSAPTVEHIPALSITDAPNGAFALNGYGVVLTPLGNNFVIQRRDTGAGTDLVTGSFTFATNTAHRILWSRRRNWFGVKMWTPNTGVMPGAWTAQAVDNGSRWKGPRYGVVMLSVLNGNTAAATEITWRNLVVSVPQLPKRMSSL